MSPRTHLYTALARRKSQVAPGEAELAAIAAREVDGRPVDQPSGWLLHGTRVGRRLIADTWVFRIAPARRTPRSCVVYFHGGGYTGGPTWMAWYAAGRLARELDAEVWAPCYRLAPRQTAALTVPKSAAIFAAARAAWPQGPVALTGDSAGGGLALAVAQRAVSDGVGGPEALALISPWSDLTCPDEDPDQIDLRDPFLATARGVATGRLYAGDLPLGHPVVSPLYGPMAGLPPTWLFGGDCDILIYQIRRLAQAMRAGGVQVDFLETSGGVHVEPLFPTPPGARLFRAMESFFGAVGLGVS